MNLEFINPIDAQLLMESFFIEDGKEMLVLVMIDNYFGMHAQLPYTMEIFEKVGMGTSLNYHQGVWMIYYLSQL